MFVDKAIIEVRAGKGGDGAVSFHREKYVAAGGPDGGDGGDGGDVVCVPDAGMSTLMDFRYRRKYAAGDGAGGAGGRRAGKRGEDLVIRVPLGTVVRDRATGAVMADMSAVDRFVVAKGGSGGWGNAHFATPTRQCPRFAKAGLPGGEREVVLELKLLADVGLVGFPNAGKSTLLAAVTRARPKIANYPFTTLYPNLGVVYAGEGRSFVMADIPGLIEGASGGAGLGHDFLRHVDRCRLLIHVVDVSGCEGRDPVADFETVNRELAAYSPALAARPMVVAANKTDMAAPEQIAALERRAGKAGMDFFPVCAAAGTGTEALTRAVARRLADLPPIAAFQPEYVPPEPEDAGEPAISREDGVWYVDGGFVERLVENVNFGDYESRMYFDRVLRERGVFEKLEELGVDEGDTVCVHGVQFEYRK